MTSKYIKDGFLHIVLNDCFGLSWACGYEQKTEMRMYDPTLIQMILDKRNSNEIKDYITGRYGEHCFRLVLEKIPVGKKFYVYECDGKDTLVMEDEFLTA